MAIGRPKLSDAVKAGERFEVRLRWGQKERFRLAAKARGFLNADGEPILSDWVIALGEADAKKLKIEEPTKPPAEVKPAPTTPKKKKR